MTSEIRKYGDRTAVQLTCPAPGRTKQSMSEECDVNYIMNKWKRTGELPPSHQIPPTYGDFSNVVDYMQAKNALLEADQAFAGLPSWVRSRFQNSPHELLAYMEDPANTDEAIKLGLIAPPAGDEAPVADPEPEPTPAPTPPPAGD